MQSPLIAGDSLSFLTLLPDYPATEGWVLKHRLVPRTAANAVIELTATAEGDGHRTEATATTTAAWSPDNYSWYSWVELGSQKASIGSGQKVVQQDPRTATAGHDGRSLARRTLDDLKAAYADFSAGTRGQTRRYRIGEREMEFSSRAEIVQQINFWENEVAREIRQERLAQGLPDPRKVYVRVNRE